MSVAAPAESAQGKVLKNSALLGTVFGVNLLAGSITSILLAYLLTVEDLGVYGHYLRAYAWLVAIAGFVFPPVLVRYTAELIGARNEGAAWRLLKKAMVLQTGFMAVVLVCYFVYTMVSASPPSSAVLLIVAGAATAYVYGQVGESFLRGLQNFRYVAWAGIGAATARLASLGVLFLTGATVLSALAVFAVGNVAFLITSMIALWVLYRAFRRQHPEESVPIHGLRRRVAEYAGAMGAGGLLSLVIWNYMEVFLLHHFWEGREGQAYELAYYTFAISLAAVPIRLGKILSGAMLPAFSELFGSGEWHRIRRGYHYATVLSTAAGFYFSVMLIVFAEPIIRGLFPDTLLPSVVPFQLLLIPSLFLAINHAGGAVGPALEGHRFFLATVLVLAPLNIVLGFVLIPTMGAVGCALVNSVVQSLAVFCGGWYVAVRRGLGFPLFKVLATAAAALVCGAGAYALMAIDVGIPEAVWVLGIAAAASCLYALLLRVLKVIGNEEGEALLRVAAILPASLRKPASTALRLVIAP